MSDELETFPDVPLAGEETDIEVLLAGIPYAQYLGMGWSGKGAS